MFFMVYFATLQATKNVRENPTSTELKVSKMLPSSLQHVTIGLIFLFEMQSD